tara:strand:- start:548 stop:961 length:414 start_codon:yes stop_codon:yes gene_type:complete
MFHENQFVATEWSTARDKAKFANHFVRFVEKGFPDSLFHKWFYTRLSMMFGHIAHYTRHGFYETWFTAADRKRDFLVRAVESPCHGDPTFTYSDVEKVLADWASTSGHIHRLTGIHEADVAVAERAELARLQAKYAT